MWLHEDSVGGRIMITFEINKTFKNYKECEKWEEENCPDRNYQGHPILIIMHKQTLGSEEVTITTIMCF